MAPIDDGDVGEKDRKCEFEGRIYEHNQFFSNNNTHITPTRSNQCVNCICQVCELKKLSIFKILFLSHFLKCAPTYGNYISNVSFVEPKLVMTLF